MITLETSTAHARSAADGAGEDIAIVGLSCIFPGADSPAQFWQNIVGKVDAISSAPPDWQPELFYNADGPEVDRTYTKRGGFLGDLCRFNPLKYGVPPSAIDGAEPDHFIALRCAFEAFKDAGIPRLPIDRAKTGIILGRGIFVNRGWVTVLQRTLAVNQLIEVLRQLEPHRDESEFELIRQELKKHLPPCNADTFPGIVHSALVGRIANRLDLNGPAYTIDAACSSTLLAVEHGVRELRAGRCSAVLAGGSQVSTPGMVHVMFCQLQALSRSGMIAPFSDKSAGTLLGQGCGMLLLKRRSDAENDGNRIYALIKAVGSSSDGNGAGLLAPRTEGQQLSIRRAYEEAHISPSTVGLLEAHGTGIPLGDAVEINSLNACFGKPQRGRPDVALGSVKSMVGHLLPASAAASLIKTTLALYHRTLPPTLHAEVENPQLELSKTRFYLATEPKPWIHGNALAPRRAGVNAFGFGGINSHAILEEYPHDENALADLDRRWPCELVVVSAENREQLLARVEHLARWLPPDASFDLLDLAASCAAEGGASRLAIVAKSPADLLTKLAHAAKLLAEPERNRIQDRAGLFWYEQPLAQQGRVAVVFPGEGSQYPNMLAELCRHFPEVRHQFDLTSQAFEQRGWPFAEVLFPQPSSAKQVEPQLFQTEIAIASVTAAGRGLWRLLQRFGVTPDAVVGHSSGEYAALLASGACARQDDARLVDIIAAGTDSASELRRSQLMPSASLLSVGGVPENLLNAILADQHGAVVLAMDNCPHQRILAGSEAGIASVLAALQGKGGLCQRLTWDRPYHTAAFQPALPIVERYVDFLDLRAPQIEIWSCASASAVPAEASALRALAVDQWRRPVRFRETVQAMHAAGVRVFIEVGPRGNLSAFIGDTLSGQPHAAVALDVPNKNGIEQLCRALGALAAHGVPVQLNELFSRRGPRPIDFEGEAPVPKRREPILPLELPLLRLDEAAVEAWQANARAADLPPNSARGLPRDLAAPPAHPAAPAIAGEPASESIRAAVDGRHSEANHEIGAAASSAKGIHPSNGSSHGNGHLTVPRHRATSHSTAANGNGGHHAEREPITVNHGALASVPGQAEPRPENRSSAGLAIDPLAVGRSAASSPAIAPVPLAGPAIEVRRAAHLDFQRTMQSFLKTQAAIAHLYGSRHAGRAAGAIVEAPDFKNPPRPEDLACANAAERAMPRVDAFEPARLTSGFPPSAPLPSASQPSASQPSASQRPAFQPPAPPIARSQPNKHQTAAAGADALQAIRRAAAQYPFMETVLESTPGVRLVVECELSLAKHPFLRDHTFFGRRVSDHDPELTALPIMPLAMTLEFMAEAASLLCPGQTVTALCRVRASRWLAMYGASRRVRIIATCEADSAVQVRVVEADGDGEHEIAAGVVELSPAAVSLGAPRLPQLAQQAPPWRPEDVYGKYIYHGPAFQGIDLVEDWGPQGVRAAIHQPEPATMWPGRQVPNLVLPVALIDIASQLPGIVNVNWNLVGSTFLMAFPNEIGRIEFAPAASPEGPLVGTATIAQSSEKLYSDTEIVNADGEVVLRYLDKIEELVSFSLALYQYAFEPHRPLCSSALQSLFAGVPGANHCQLTHAEMAAAKLLVKSFWANVVARLVLNHAERAEFQRLKLPPVPLASWLLARLAAKEAVRTQALGGLACLADVGLQKDSHGQPQAILPDGAIVPVSLAHKPFYAVAVAAEPGVFRGIGIDCEPLQPLPEELLAEAFDADERALLAATAGTAEAATAWRRAGWCAKEAVGKALGRGVLGGPRCVQIVACDAGRQSVSVVLAGAMAAAFPEYGRADARPIEVSWRQHEQFIVGLCLLPKT
ncbi:MAG TPA: beta-ketoacyl synthase N-terminal-like domain-containing protein [Pirellulales bacterium]|jgi:acyl transferase domain-containing protein/phosphopantetheinyl transferase|nr:beta-ketoacyl synthase N-terminal-like domain-containing protein [Pirellulales bacterium]